VIFVINKYEASKSVISARKAQELKPRLEQE